jgi:hypothetical protein
VATETLRPNGAGDETNIGDQYPTSGAHWDKVDEVTPDEGSTYVGTYNSAYQRDLYNLADHIEGAGTINFVKVYARGKVTASPTQASLKIAVKSGATVAESSEKTITTSWANYSQQWDTNPNTGAAWTWDEIDSLQAGITVRRCNASGEYTVCTQLYVEVDYSSVTAKTSSDTGSGADACVSLGTGEVKTSSDAGSGVEGTPLPGATLTAGETGSSIEAIVARLLVNFDVGYGVEASGVESGVLENLFSSELGEGLDSLVAKIERPDKGGGMKLWT